MFYHDAALKRLVSSPQKGARPLIHARPRTPIVLEGKSQIQPASFDPRLGNRIIRMRSAALPGVCETVDQLINRYGMYDFSLSSGKTNILERGCTYIAVLEELLDGRDVPDLRTVFSPKSSTGRVDVMVSAISDHSFHYNRTEPGYRGPLYLEIIPLSFHVAVKRGVSLTQFRVRDQYDDRLSTTELRGLHTNLFRRSKGTDGLLFDRVGKAVSPEEINIQNGRLYFTIDLARPVVGFRAKTGTTEILDLTQTDAHQIDDFWDVLGRPKNGELLVEEGAFLLLSSAERVKIPPDYCAEIAEYDPIIGEFRTHYAGFFDNGFGGAKGTHVVLEVRMRDKSFRFINGQMICSMEFFRTKDRPETLYGDGALGSNYVGSGPSHAKYFKDREVAWEG